MLRLPAALVVSLVGAVPAAAQVSPTIESFARTRTVRLGVADDAPPFSWIGKDGTSIGYAVDLCRRVATDAAATIGWQVSEAGTPLPPRTIQLQFVHLQAADEPGAIANGAVDLGCSALSPAQAAALSASPAVALSRTRLLAARLGDVSSTGDLAGRTVAVVANTNAAARLAVVASTLSPHARVQEVPGPGDGYELLATGAVDAFAADDLHLAGLLATRTDGPSFRIVGETLSEQPLALRFRADDPAFAALVARSFRHMEADGTLRALYLRWFTTAVPDGASLDRPPPPALLLGG